MYTLSLLSSLISLSLSLSLSLSPQVFVPSLPSPLSCNILYGSVHLPDFIGVNRSDLCHSLSPLTCQCEVTDSQLIWLHFLGHLGTSWWVWFVLSRGGVCVCTSVIHCLYKIYPQKVETFSKSSVVSGDKV